MSSSLFRFLFLFCLCQLAAAGEICRGQDRDNIYQLPVTEQNTTAHPDATFLRFKELYRQSVHAGDISGQGTALTNMGAICFHLGHYAKALEYYLEAKKLFEKSSQKQSLADVYNKLGTLYYYNRDTMKARNHHEYAIQIYRAIGDEEGTAVTLGKIGALFEKKQLPDSAFYYQRQALIAYGSVNNKEGMAKIYENLGSIHEDLSHYDSAMYYFQTAFKLYTESGASIQTVEIINNLGDIYRKTGRLKQGLAESFKALQLAQLHNEPYQISSAYRDISKAYNLLQQNDSAFYYSEIARSYLLDIYSAENNKQMAFLQALDDMERKNNEIRTLQNERKLTFITTIATIVIIILLIIAILSVMSRQRLKLKIEQETSNQKLNMVETRRQLAEAGLKASILEEETLKAELRNKQLEREKLDIEFKNKEMEEHQLKMEIEVKSKELSTHVLHVIQKNQLLEGLKKDLEQLIKDDKRDQKKQMKQVIQQINQNFNNDAYWNDFSNTFEQIHTSFFENLNIRYPGLTATDLKLVSLLKMNMDSNDMTTMLGISPDSLRVARYRLRKKLNLNQGENLTAFLQAMA